MTWWLKSLGPSPDPPLSTLVTLGKVRDLSVPWWLLLENGKNNSASLLRLLRIK